MVTTSTELGSREGGRPAEEERSQTSQVRKVGSKEECACGTRGGEWGGWGERRE